MTLKNNRAPLLSKIKLCASFHHHMWIQTGATVRKKLSWVLTSVTLTFDLWPCPFAWTSLLSLVITPDNFMMIKWWEHNQKGVMDRRTDWTIHRATWLQLKITTKLGISREEDHNLITSADGHDASPCQIWGNSLHKCPENIDFPCFKTIQIASKFGKHTEHD